MLAMSPYRKNSRFSTCDAYCAGEEGARNDKILDVLLRMLHHKLFHIKCSDWNINVCADPLVIFMACLCMDGMGWRSSWFSAYIARRELGGGGRGF